MKWIAVYFASLFAFLVLDAGWITLVATKQYRREAGDILRRKPQILPGILFYILYVGGVVAFAILPMSRHFHGITATFKMALEVTGWGFGLGVFAYSSFSLTNQSILKDWKAKLAVSDMVWGGVLTATVSLIGFSISRLFQ